MAEQRRLLSVIDFTQARRTENRIASFPHPAIRGVVTDYTNSAGECSSLRSRHSTVNEEAVPAARHVDVVRADGTYRATRGVSAPEIENSPRPSSKIAQCEESDPCAQLAAGAPASELRRNEGVAVISRDPVVRSVSRALQAAEEGDDHPCAEALRVAIAVRLMGLRAEPRTEAEPAQAKRRQVQALQKWRLKRVVEYMNDHLSAKITLSDLAAVAGLSRMHFASQFRVATNLRPHEFLLQERIKRAEALLQSTTTPIVEIALTVGFQTQAHFTTVFKRFVGETPQRWRGTNQMPSVPQTQGGRRGEVSVLA